MWLSKSGQQIVKIINLMIRLGAYIGIAILIAMMMLTVCDVFLRYAFNRPIFGGIEISESMLITIAFLSIAYCALEEGNVKMDYFVSRLSLRGQVSFEIVGYIFGLILTIPMTYLYLPKALHVKHLGESSDLLGIPAYPFYLVVFVGCLLLSLVLLTQLVKSVFRLVKH